MTEYGRRTRRLPQALRPTLAAVLAYAASAPLSAQGPKALAFQGVTVVDVATGHLVPSQTVVVEGNRIRAQGPVNQVHIPSGAQVVDARGKYLIPGLWDMHAHTEFPTSDTEIQDSLYRKFYPVYIANGVTGLREMAQRFPNGADSFRVWQKQVMAGTRIGPRAVGPSADLTYELDLSTADDADRIIDSLKRAGDAFVKFHDDQMEADLYFALVRAARRVGLPLVGHVPRTVTNVQAADSGQLSIEHAGSNHQCWPHWKQEPLGDSAAAEARCAPVAQAYVRNGTWIVPTLVLLSYYTTERFGDAKQLVRMLHRLGVRKILAGSDCAAEVLVEWGVDPVCRRGFSILQEIVILGASGLTPLEALQAATLNPATYFGATDSLGTVAAGKLADLVLLDADPLADLRNVMKIQAVVANGRYFDRATLDALDPESVALTRSYLAADAKPEPSSSTSTTSTP